MTQFPTRLSIGYVERSRWTISASRPSATGDVAQLVEHAEFVLAVGVDGVDEVVLADLSGGESRRGR